MQTNPEACPLCGTELSQTKFREIKARQREMDERRAAELAEAKAAISRSYEEEYKNKFDLAKRQAERTARSEAAKETAQLVAKHDQLVLQLKEAADRESEIRKQAKAEIIREKQLAEKKARADADAELRKIAAERDQAAAKLKEAQAREAAIRKEVADQAEKTWQKELIALRQSLENDKKTALLKQQSEHNRERESWQKKVGNLETQLQQKTPNQLGDGGEVEIFDALRDAFPDDRISRIEKGRRGPDILHEVLYKGEVCGRIVTDSKNQQEWRAVWVTKLRQDKLEAKAEHAILATTVFPPKRKELCIESGVIVVSPLHIVHIVQLFAPGGNHVIRQPPQLEAASEQNESAVRLHRISSLQNEIR